MTFDLPILPEWLYLSCMKDSEHEDPVATVLWGKVLLLYPKKKFALLY
jgi:hypothetical protein